MTIILLGTILYEGFLFIIPSIDIFPDNIKSLILVLEKNVLTFKSSRYDEFKIEKASIIHLSILPFCIG